MRTLHPYLLSALAILFASSATIQAEEPTQQVKSDTTAQKTIDSFTGRVIKNKVRIRLQPTFDGYVIGELNKGDLVLTLGEAEDFYAIQPSADAKGYIFRTFVLDNVIEGNKVNVRLKPDLDAPVVAQLNSGDRVDGVISSTNNKWYEIKLPKSARYYVSKDYVEKAGDAKMIVRQAKRQAEVQQLLTTTDVMSQNELQKPFEQINADTIKTNYNHIILDFTDFPDTVAKAKTQLSTFENAYAANKMNHLETQAQRISSDLELKNQKLSEELTTQKQKMATLEQQLQEQQAGLINPSAKIANQLPMNMAEWLPREESLFLEWSKRTGNDHPADYYAEQTQKSIRLKGVIEAYNRPVKNKPGDYMLINSATKLPIAFLYSTQINLQDVIGHEVTLQVISRPNNHYAFPAYFVLSIE